MSLDKAIKYGKEYRKPYYDFRQYDPWLRNHGKDDWSNLNRLYQYLKEIERTDYYLKVFFKNDEDVSL